MTSVTTRLTVIMYCISCLIYCAHAHNEDSTAAFAQDFLHILDSIAVRILIGSHHGFMERIYSWNISGADIGILGHHI